MAFYARYGFADHDGNERTLNKHEKEIQQLQQTIKELNEQVETLDKQVQKLWFAPGGPGWQMAKDDFNANKNELVKHLLCCSV